MLPPQAKAHARGNQGLCTRLCLLAVNHFADRLSARHCSASSLFSCSFHQRVVRVWSNGLLKIKLLSIRQSQMVLYPSQQGTSKPSEALLNSEFWKNSRLKCFSKSYSLAPKGKHESILPSIDSTFHTFHHCRSSTGCSLHRFWHVFIIKDPWPPFLEGTLLTD